MGQSELHEPDKLIRYAFGDLPEKEQNTVDQHLRSCTSCQEFVSFVREFNSNLREARPLSRIAEETCPDPSLVVALEANELDKQAAQHVRAHMLFCRDCLEEYFALRRLSRTFWQEVVEKLKGLVIDLGRTYAPGTLIGSIRIVAEQPALGVRGDKTEKAPSKVLEVSVGENTYSIELAVTEQSSVSFDIAGFRTPVKGPLGISLRSETGGNFFSTQSDEFGNTHFVVPGASLPDDILLLTLNLKGSEQQLLLRIPEK